jgi:O-acetyl-ADP-ribose deacetylase (regulator of RNase III)
MKEIKYVKGDATDPQNFGQHALIVHICNDIGAWGKGFVLSISRRWPIAETQYRNWSRAKTPPFKLGRVQFVLLAKNLTIANMIAQHDIRPKSGLAPIRYGPLGRALERVAEFAKQNQATVHMPRIGCGLAGGKWHKVEPIIIEQLCKENIQVTVYDL